MKVIIYNKTLNPAFWTPEKQLRPEVRTSLLKIGKQFWKDVELKIHIRDVLFLGSSANYNWTPTSDCDLHLLVDFNDLPMSPEIARQYTKTLTKKWNEEQDITIKGYNVEVYIQDVSEENKATGVYSLIQNKWIKEASPQNIVLNKQLIQEKYTTWVRRINNSITSNDPEKLKKTMEDLVKMRESGLSAAGEFSTENIVFKILRQRNVIGKLKDSIQRLKNTKLSLNETENVNLLYFTGIVNDRGGVEAYSHDSTKSGKSHRLFGFKENGRWRYIPKYNRVDWSDDPTNDQMDSVDWSDDPTNDQMDSVDNFLNKRGIHPVKHMAFIGSRIFRTNQNLKDGFDPTSFGPNPAATVGVSLSSSDGGHDKDFYQRHVNTMKRM